MYVLIKLGSFVNDIVAVDRFKDNT